MSTEISERIALLTKLRDTTQDDALRERVTEYLDELAQLLSREMSDTEPTNPNG